MTLTLAKSQAMGLVDKRLILKVTLLGLTHSKNGLVSYLPQGTLLTMAYKSED